MRERRGTSPPGRPKGEYRSAQHEGGPIARRAVPRASTGVRSTKVVQCAPQGRPKAIASSGSGAQRRHMSAPAHFVIDVVVPVYNAPDDVRACVESVLAHLRPDVRLVLIDDASPDPRIAQYFGELERRAHPQVVLLRNERNLGFTGTANRGMQLSRADVVLLNSDTIVTAGWLDALMHCAATDPRIGTITPFSNNAEICSFPRFCENNAVAGRRRPRAGARGARRGRGPDLSGPADGRRLLHVRPPRAARRESASSTWRSGWATARRTTCACARRARDGATCSPTTRSSRTRAGARSPARRPSSARATWRCCSSAIRTTSTWCARTSPPIRCGRCARRRRCGSPSTRSRGAACCT